jgi:hypothetical protein
MTVLPNRLCRITLTADECAWQAVRHRALLRTVGAFFGALLIVMTATASAQQQPPASTAPPADIANEYRITGYPNYPLTDKLSGFGYLGYVSKPVAEYASIYLGTGTFYRPHKNIQLWLGLIGVWTAQEVKSNLLELRPFGGIKFMGANARKWRYYNWTRYELRLTETRDTGDWTTVHRIRNQSRIDFPLTSVEKAWTPKTFYAWTDIEPIWRSDTGHVDPLRWRTGLGYIANPRLLIEFQYYAQYTPPSGGSLKYTDNIFRLNFKVMTKRGLLPQKALRSLLDGGIDDE